MRYKVDANGESPIPYDFTIGITTAYRLNTEQIDDVLIHEMIHYHIAYHQLRTIPGLPTTEQLRAAPIGCHPTSYWLSRPRTATTSSRQ